MNDYLPKSIAELILIRLAIIRRRALATHHDHQAVKCMARFWLGMAIAYPVVLILTATAAIWPAAIICVLGSAYSIHATHKFRRRARAASSACLICHPPCEPDQTTA